MAKPKTQYKCSNCGKMEPKWTGRCDQCNQWNTFEEVTVTPTASSSPASMRKSAGGQSRKPVRLNTVAVGDDHRIITSIGELNRVLGGGIVRDSVNILSAPPGMGKSTLLVQMANDLATAGHVVLYASGEESDTQIKGRADRIFDGNISDNLYVVSETSLNRIQDYIREIDPDVVIVDSIQTVYLEDIQSRPGTPTQVNECTYALMEIAKNPSRSRSIFQIGHMTKEDELMGSRTLEHAVDAVMYLEGDRNEQLRTLKAIKNRFGDTGETGLFQMNEKGLLPIDNPSKFFVTEREEAVAGSALTMTKEGTRNLVVEVESLVSKSYYGFPSRMSNGIRKELLQILVEILEQRGGISCNDKNVTVMVTGGLKLTEPSVNLGIIMSIVSSVYNRPIPQNVVFVGEVGLTGEIKRVPNLEARIRELDRLGFERVYVPKGNVGSSLSVKHIEVVQVKTLHDTISAIYGGEFTESKRKRG